MIQHKKRIKKYTYTKHHTKITLATLSLGALIAPVQTAVGHATINLASNSGQVTLQAELHPHHSDHGSWHEHYVNPRSLRAVGYGDGKDTSIDADANWKFYENIRA